MARWKADRSTEGSARRAETNAVAVYLTALRAPKGADTEASQAGAAAHPSRAAVAERGRAVAHEEPRLVQRRLDIDAGLPRLGVADRRPELEETFVKGRRLVVQAQRDHRRGTARARRSSRVLARLASDMEGTMGRKLHRGRVLTVARKLHRDPVLTVATKLQAGPSTNRRCGVAGVTDA